MSEGIKRGGKMKRNLICFTKVTADVGLEFWLLSVFQQQHCLVHLFFFFFNIIIIIVIS